MKLPFSVIQSSKNTIGQGSIILHPFLLFQYQFDPLDSLFLISIGSSRSNLRAKP